MHDQSPGSTPGLQGAVLEKQLRACSVRKGGWSKPDSELGVYKSVRIGVMACEALANCRATGSCTGGAVDGMRC
jgi:hypothetical protein